MCSRKYMCIKENSCEEAPFQSYHRGCKHSGNSNSNKYVYHQNFFFLHILVYVVLLRGQY